jgi:hypothetical protein
LLLFSESLLLKIGGSDISFQTSIEALGAAYDRYVRGEGKRNAIEVWKFNRQVQAVRAGTLLRVQASAPFLLYWTTDEWQHSTDTRSRTTKLGIEFVDIPLAPQSAPVRFTFFWVEENRLEGRDYKVAIQFPAKTQVAGVRYAEHASRGREAPAEAAS